MSSINQPGIPPQGVDPGKVENKKSDVSIKIIPANEGKDLSKIKAQESKAHENPVKELPIEKVVEIPENNENIENKEEEKIENLSDVIDLSDLNPVENLSDIIDLSDLENQPPKDSKKDPMLALLREQYNLAKTGKENLIQIMNIPQDPMKLVSGAAVGLPVISAHLPNSRVAQDVTIKADLGTISMLYNVPKDMGNVALLIYQNKQLGKIESQVGVMENESKLLKKELGKKGLPEGKRTELANKKAALDKEIKETKAFIVGEKKAISTEAKKIIIKNGVELPGNLLTMMRLLSITSPIVKLGLTWAVGVFGAAGAGLVMLVAKKDLAAHKEQMETYRSDAFRQGNRAKQGEEPKPVEEREIQWTKRSIGKEVDLQEGEVVTDEQAFGEIDPQNKTVTTVTEDPVGQTSYASKLRERKQNLLAMKDQAIPRFGTLIDLVKSQSDVNVAYRMLSEGIGEEVDIPSEATMKTLRGDLINKEHLGQLKEKYGKNHIEETYQTAFDGVMADIHADLDKIINGEQNAAGLRDKFEKAGLNVPYEIETLIKGVPEQTELAKLVKAELEKPEVMENLLTRFIDVNSSQQMTDSARNVIKTQTLKKQGRKLLEKVRNYSKAKIIFGGAAVAATAVIAMTSLVAFTSVAVPLALLLAPAIGMTALSGGFVLLGIMYFRKERPEEFKQSTILDQIKLTAYSVPKGIQEIRLQKNKVSSLMKIQEQKMLTLELNEKKADLKSITAAKENQKSPNAAKNQAYDEKISETRKEMAKLQNEIDKLDKQIAIAGSKRGELKKSVQGYARKVDPIQARRNEGKLKDRLETKRPFTKDVEKMLSNCSPEERERLIGLFRGFESIDSGEAINLITDALMRDTSLMDGDIKKIAAYMGIDITDQKDEDEIRNLVKQFFLGG